MTVNEICRTLVWALMCCNERSWDPDDQSVPPAHTVKTLAHTEPILSKDVGHLMSRTLKPVIKGSICSRGRCEPDVAFPNTADDGFGLNCVPKCSFPENAEGF